LLALALLALPQAASACATCFGKSDDAQARGMNMGIFTLLAVIIPVLMGFAAFAIFLARRAARFPLAPAVATDSEMPAPAAQPSK
jgi:hypothetical protein